MWCLAHTLHHVILLRLDNTKQVRCFKLQPGDIVHIAIDRSSHSLGPAGTAHDYALMESTIGLH